MVKKRTRAATGAGAPGDNALLDLVMSREAAALLRLSVRTLEGYRFMGIGPAYFRFANRTFYAKGDLARWAAARRYRTTAEADANRWSRSSTGRGACFARDWGAVP